MSEETEPEIGFFGQLKNQIITGAGAILATLGTVFIDEIKSIAGIEEEEQQTEQVQGVQQNNQQTQQVVINIPEQKSPETKTVIIREASPIEKKVLPKKTETEKRKEEGLDW